MRDEIDARMWVAHHEAFSEAIHAAAVACRAVIRRLGWAAIARWFRPASGSTG